MAIRLPTLGRREREVVLSAPDPLTDVPDSMLNGKGFHLEVYSVLDEDFFGRNRITRFMARKLPVSLKLTQAGMTRNGFGDKEIAKEEALAWQKTLNHGNLSGGQVYVVKVKKGSNY